MIGYDPGAAYNLFAQRPGAQLIPPGLVAQAQAPQAQAAPLPRASLMSGVQGLMADPMFMAGLGMISGNYGSNKGDAMRNAMAGGMQGMMGAGSMQMLRERQAMAQAEAQERARKAQAQQELRGLIQSGAINDPTQRDKVLGLASIINPEAVLGSMLQGQKSTDDLLEYQRAVEQGYQGDFMEYMRAIKPAATTSVHVTPQINFPWQAQTAPGKEMQDRASIVQTYGPDSPEVRQYDSRINAERTKPLPTDAQEKLRGGVSSLDSLKVLEENVDAFGLLAGPRTKAAASLGGQPESVAVAEAIRKMETDMQSLIKGIPSNYDMKLFINRIPRLMGATGGLGDTRETAKEKIKLLKKEAEGLIRGTISYYKGIGGYAVPPEVEKMAEERGIKIDEIEPWNGITDPFEKLLGVPPEQRKNLPPGTRMQTPVAPAAGPFQLPPGVTVERID